MGAKPASTPMVKSPQFDTTKSALLSDPSKYRRVIGRLLYLGFTRPDITFATQQLSQYVHAPYECHWQAALHVLRYLKGDPAKGLFYSYDPSSSLSLQAFCDADWATCPDTRRSITGYSIFFGTNFISWKSKKQVTVSRRSAEAEYRALSTTVCELLWISYLLKDLQLSIITPIPLSCDSQAVLHIVANPVFHERTKHLAIDCHLVRDQYKLGFVHPQHVSSACQLADFFTKPLPGPRFDHLLSKLGLRNLQQSPT